MEELPAPWSALSFDSGDYSGLANNRVRPRNRKRQRRMSGLVTEFERAATTPAAAALHRGATSSNSPRASDESDNNMQHLMTSFRKAVQILQSRSVISVPSSRRNDVAACQEEIFATTSHHEGGEDYGFDFEQTHGNNEKQSTTSLPTGGPNDDDDDDDDEKEKEFVRLSKPTPWMSILYLTVFSVLGAWLRIFLGRLFGNECQKIIDDNGDDENTGTTWMHNEIVTRLNLCVTSNGKASSPGGAGGLFSDIIANMLGCFLMGLLQPTHDLNLLSDVPLSFLPVKHWFQTCHVLHLGLRTGFCGSLTTLASWNTQMVAMVDGSIAANNESQFFSALVGYIIGLQCAVASLGAGQMCAVWLHRYTNPQMAKEEDIVMFAYSKAACTTSATTSSSAKADNRPYAVNKKLPDYERRYLANLLPKEQQEWAKKNVSALDYLEQWKISTDEYRLVGDMEDNVLVALHEIERRILVDDEGELPERLIKVAEQYKWNVQALQAFENAVKGTWISGTTVDHEGDDASQDSRSASFHQHGFLVSLPILLAVVVLLLYCILDVVSTRHDGATWYRQMWLSVLFAPFGTLIRWKLTRLNGSLKGKLDWLPVGTLYANLFACLISAATNGLTNSSQVWSANGLHFLYAVQTGFAGCMSTVSTYAVEGDMLQKSFPHHAKASLYMTSTLAIACVLGLIVYIPIVRAL